MLGRAEEVDAPARSPVRITEVQKTLVGWGLELRYCVATVCRYRNLGFRTLNVACMTRVWP